MFSHLLLDYLPARLYLLRLYNGASRTAWPGLRESIIAEIWLYGFFLVVVLLWQSARAPGCSRPARNLAWLLVGASLLAALSRNAYVWAPVFAVAGAHALLLLRRALRWALLWNLVPLIPMAAMGAVELWSLLLYRQARKLQAAGQFAAAAEWHRDALGVPTRTSKVGIYVYLSICEMEMKNWAAAESNLLTAARIAEDPTWPELSLAEFYVSGRVRDSVYFRPEEARRIAEKIVAGPYTPVQKGWAADILRRCQIVLDRS